MKETSTLYFSKPFAKGLKVLGLFSNERTSLSLKEIAEIMDTDRSSAYRFTNTLVELNYLKKDPRSKLLTLGPSAYFLGLNLVKSFSLRQVIRPFIDDVHHKYGITIDAAFLEGDIAVQLYYCPAENALTYQLPIVNPAIHCTSVGKAILAFLPKDEMLAIVDRLPLVKKTERSITNKEDLLADLKKTRQKGYAINNEELVVGQIVIGAPFFNLETGRPMGAVSFDFSIIQNTLKGIETKYLDILLKLAKDISGVIH
jgi:IclR family pca regulon transcriptional regulator